MKLGDSKVGMIVVSVTACVVVVIVIIIAFSFLTEKRGNLDIKIINGNLKKGYDYNLYANGGLIHSGHIEPNYVSSIAITSIKLDSPNQKFVIELVSSDNSIDIKRNVTLSDGMTGYVEFSIAA